MSNKSTELNVICLAPVKNEAALLERFLRCALQWADRVILLDQSSDESCVRIAEKFAPQVELIRDQHGEFDEPRFRARLIEAGRQLPMPRLLVALDADEVLSANILSSPEWESVRNAVPGTLVRFELANLHPDGESFWTEDYEYPFALMDDGTPFNGRFIHGPRMAIPERGPCLTLRDIKVLHYAYLDPARLASKLRWYQCLEVIRQADADPVKLFRKYQPPGKGVYKRLAQRPGSWFAEYEQAGIDMSSVYRPDDFMPGNNHMDRSGAFWWDEQVLQWFVEHGVYRFKRLAIWDTNWNRLANRFGIEGQFEDPRSRFDKAVHWWLEKSRLISKPRIRKTVDKLLSGTYR